MSIASLFRPGTVVVTGGRHAAPETEERPAAPFNPAPGRHAAPEDDEPAFDVDLDVDVDVDVDLELDDDLLDSLGFAYED